MLRSGGAPALYKGAAAVRAPAAAGGITAASRRRRAHVVHVWSAPHQYREADLVAELVRVAAAEADSLREIAVLYRNHIMVRGHSRRDLAPSGDARVTREGCACPARLGCARVAVTRAAAPAKVEPIEKLLRREGIPYLKHAQRGFWDSKEVATALALMRLAADPQVRLCLCTCVRAWQG